MSRINGLNAGDLIQNPAGATESLLRDIIHVEMGLVIDIVDGTDITIDGSVNDTPLRSALTNYYGGISYPAWNITNNSYLVNVSKNETYEVVSSNGATRTLNLISAPTGWAAGDKCYLKNVNCLVDVDSFDVQQAAVMATGNASSTSSGKLVSTGENFLTTILPGMLVENTTDATVTYVKSVDSDTQLTLEDDLFVSGNVYEIRGKREGWKVARSTTSQQDSRTLLNGILFESHSMLFKSQGRYRIVDLADGNIAGTLSSPLYENGNPLVSSQLTSLLNIYSSFVLNYGYDHTKKSYTKKVTVDKNSATDSSLYYLMAYCSSAETDYKVNRKFEYNSDWIQDDATAYKLMEKLVLWFTYQRMIVNYTGNIKDHIKYEVGDRVKINFDYMLPTSKNNSQQFLITDKIISTVKKKVQLTLLY